jgi:ATP-dependent helicase/nuclease subunit A
MSGLMEEQAGLLFEMAAAFDRALQDRKIREGLMDFDDLETYALQLLGMPSVARRYQKRYLQIFVDEYQDTSYMQEAVLSRIQAGNRLFFVGDGKQSIYQFRGAAPRLFLSKVEEREADFTCIRLNHNFRSSQTVIDGVNDFFNRRMTKDFGGVAYKETDQLKSGAYHASAVKPAFVVLQGEEGVKDEIQWVAEEIGRLLEAGHPPQSIAVLARSLQPIQEAVRAIFQKEGIPLQTSQQTTSKNNLVIGMFQALLAWINGGVSDQALLAVMRFPQWGFSPEELSMIRIAYPEKSFGQACRYYGRDRKDGLAAKLQGFHQEMDGLRDRSHRIPLADFLDELLSWRDFADAILAMPDGLQRSYGLRAYVEEVKGRIARGPMTLHQVCMTIQEENREGIGTALPSIQGDQGIRLMTIHGSKGLEFETVFLINTAQGANLFDLNQSVLIHDDFGMAMTVYDPAAEAIDIPLERRIAEILMRRHQVSEEARIFYVGMTRAVERLYVVAHDRDPAKTRANRPYLKTVAGGLDSPSLYHWMVGAGMDQSAAWNFFEIALAKGQRGSAGVALKEELELQEDEGIFEQAGSYEKGRNKRRKVNITEWIEGSKKRKLTFEENTQAIDCGNAFHEVLEKVPLIKLDGLAHARKAIDELKMSRRITEKTACLVDPEGLLAWSMSSLGDRILSADQVLREKAFVGKLPDDAGAQYAQGKIDCLFREGDEWVLADYKLNMPKDMEAARSQVRAYCKLLRACFGMRIGQAYLYVWRTGRVLDVDLD